MFFIKKILDVKFLLDLLVILITGVSQKRIDYRRKHESCFQDLNDGYCKQLDNFAQVIDDVMFTYHIVIASYL
jgi:hypothetical protein